MDAVINWAKNILIENDYISESTPLLIQDNPWSIVWHFKTSKGNVFLKKVPEKLFIETKVIQILDSNFKAKVPHVLAENELLNCFLMQDAGVKLYEFFVKRFEKKILEQALKEYITVQIASMDKVNLFSEIGVPAWKIAQLPTLYLELLMQEKLLLEDGLSKEELNHLKKLTTVLETLCQRLSRFNIKDTFGHADLHDKNILIDHKFFKTTLIDLGEVVITPGYSYILFCYSIPLIYIYQELNIHEINTVILF